MMSANLMNGQDVPDFYAAPRSAPALFSSAQPREVIHYTEDGRPVLDGQPLHPRQPDQLWRELLLQAMCHRIRTTKPSSFVKRLLSKRNSHRAVPLDKRRVEPAANKMYVTNITIED